MPFSTTKPMAVLIAAAALTGQPVAASDFTNCSGSGIRITIHDNGTGEPSPRQQSNGTLSANAKQSFELAGGLYLVKVFGIWQGRERLIYLRGDLSGTVENYTFHRTGGHSYINAGEDCAAAMPVAVNKPVGIVKPAPGEKPFATSMVTSGIWVSGGAIWFRIADFDGKSFRLRLSPGSRRALGLAEQNAWSTFRLIAKDSYRDADGNNFVIRQEFQATWNGIALRYSWLE